MGPPTQTASGQPTLEAEEGESHDFDQLARVERMKSCVSAVKKRQSEFQEELSRLEAEKEAHIREVRRLRDEQSSQYCERQLLNRRYQIVELLGKGGFSEVWHAFDVEALTDVAIKIHQLSAAWSDERKSNYIKHAIRENDIQKVGSAKRGSQGCSLEWLFACLFVFGRVCLFVWLVGWLVWEFVCLGEGLRVGNWLFVLIVFP